MNKSIKRSLVGALILIFIASSLAFFVGEFNDIGDNLIIVSASFLIYFSSFLIAHWIVKEESSVKDCNNQQTQDEITNK